MCCSSRSRHMRIASASLVAVTLLLAPCAIAQAQRSRLLPRQDHQPDHRLSAGGRQRRLCARGRAPPRQAHSRQPCGRAAQPAGRRQPGGREPHLQRRAEGRHHARPPGADHSARREARRPGRQVSGRGLQLDRPHGAGAQRDLHHVDVGGEDHRGRLRQGRGSGCDRPQRHQSDLSDRAQQRARHQVQDRQRLRRLRRGDARDGARRGRRPLVDL